MSHLLWISRRYGSRRDEIPEMPEMPDIPDIPEVTEVPEVHETDAHDAHPHTHTRDESTETAASGQKRKAGGLDAVKTSLAQLKLLA